MINEFENAIESYNKAINLYPEYEAAYVGIGKAQMCLENIEKH